MIDAGHSRSNLHNLRASSTSRDWHGDDCWGCGINNPVGLQADFRFDEEAGEVRFRYLPGQVLRGAPEFVHGGVLAALLDESQGVLCYHLGHAVMTEQLHLNYHKATPLNRVFEVRCWATAVRRRRMYTRAELRSLPADANDAGELHGAYYGSGELLVSGRGSWYLLPDRMIRRMFEGQDSQHQAEYQAMLDVLDANRRRGRRLRRARRA